MEIVRQSLNKKPKCRVELHVHLDGAIRHETIWEVYRKKKLPLPGDGSLRDLKDALRVDEPKDLFHFLKNFGIFISAFVGDLENLERIAYEFVEDQAEQSVAYCEARFCPQIFLPGSQQTANFLEKEPLTTDSKQVNGGSTQITVEDILDAVLKGLLKGEVKFETKVNLVLCCIRGRPEWSWEILRLCEEYRDKGVVGIDIAGDDSSPADNSDQNNEECNLQEIEVFKAAKEKGICRTIHAAENGPAAAVLEAIDLLFAQRIGHGYRVLEDEDIYQRCLSEGIHFEMCPHSSYMTGSIQKLQLESKRHPILRLAEDGASFSINTDDPTVTFTRLDDEYELLRRWGFTEAHFTRANFEAAFRSFLPPEEKKHLIDSLKVAYGVIDCNIPEDPSSLSPEEVQKPEISIGAWKDRL